MTGRQVNDISAASRALSSHRRFTDTEADEEAKRLLRVRNRLVWATYVLWALGLVVASRGTWPAGWYWFAIALAISVVALICMTKSIHIPDEIRTLQPLSRSQVDDLEQYVAKVPQVLAVMKEWRGAGPLRDRDGNILSRAVFYLTERRANAVQPSVPADVPASASRRQGRG